MFHSEGKFYHEFINLNYHRYGLGENIYLAFHGFGQTGGIFKEIAEALGDEVTLYGFDLPFHGSSEWKAGESPLLKAHWEDIMGKFLQEKAIQRFTILGFSLGGKLALTTIEKFPSLIEKAILIAPDGIKTNFWYGLATYPHLLRRYFQSLIVKPDSFFKMLAAMSHLRLMDKGVLKFAGGQMNTIRKRRKVYYTWVIFRRMTFDLKKLTSLINTHEIPIDVYLGIYDKIITPVKMRSFLNALNNKRLILIKTGHNSILKKVSSELKLST